MPALNRRYIGFRYFVAILLILCVLLLSFANRADEKYLGPVGRALLLVARPIQYVIVTPFEWAKNLFGSYISLWHVKQDNERLKADNQRLTAKLHRLEETERTNLRLQRLLAFKKQNPLKFVPAQVVGEDASFIFRTVTLNKGSKDNIRAGLPVVIDLGIVGRIISCTKESSQVLLITDHRSAVDCLIQRTRARAMIKGKSRNLCEIAYLAREEDVRVGDTVITSGLTQVFPKGLLIGVVTKVKKKNYGLFQEAEVTPAVDFDRLEEVLVVVKKEL
jgi:rod shape-determining protein MreC